MTESNLTSPTPSTNRPAEKNRGLSRASRIGLGVGAAALGLVALTAGVTAVALDGFDDDDDDRVPAALSSSTSDSAGDDSGDSGDSDSDSTSGTAGSAAQDSDVTASANEFEEARDAAIDAAGGGQLIELERSRDGWIAEVLLDDGTDVDVRLTADLGESTVGTPEPSDDVRAGSFDGDGIARAIEAALDETGGAAHEIALTDDDGGAYQVDVRGDARGEVLLDEAFAVIAVDND